MRLRDTFRIASSGNPAVKAIREAFNGNADALREAQGIIIRHEDEIATLHYASRSSNSTARR